VSKIERPHHAADKRAELTAGSRPAALLTAARRTPFDATLEEHRGIRHDVQELTDLLSRYRVGMEDKVWREWMSGFSGKLEGLHARLVEHFEEEEQSGLYEVLGEKLPNLVPRTRVVREEHRTIADEIAGIRASLDVLQPTFPLEPQLLDRAREVLYRIVCHERKESDLIARAFLEDLGERN